jgi:hypothetical protein
MAKPVKRLVFIFSRESTGLKAGVNKKARPEAFKATST